MKRRKFIHYGALANASFLGNLALMNCKPSASLFSQENMSNKQHYDWIILYWMPYDNDLSPFGSPILQMLTKGVQSDNILVMVQADFLGAKNLSRSIITKGKVEVQQLRTTNSASEQVFGEYLSWAHSRFMAKKWAIIFLGHGGHLDEISPDVNIGTLQQGTQWMNIKKLSDVISNFNSAINSRVELFFFQNCNKGTIEAHYTLRDAANYTLSSQNLLGAPNYYYESLLQFLGANSELNGGQLAEKIIEFERSDMYSSYTVTDNRYVRELPARLNRLIDIITSSKFKAFNREELKLYSYRNEDFIDVVLLIEALAKQVNNIQDDCDRFVSFFKTSMIYKHQQNLDKTNSELSGLGLLLPNSKQHLQKYQYLPVFSDLKLVELFNAILFEF